MEMTPPILDECATHGAPSESLWEAAHTIPGLRTTACRLSNVNCGFVGTTSSRTNA
jgi:hypothetical protein